MTGYTTPVAQKIAERFAKSTDPDRIAAARRLIERAQPGYARADVIESCYKDAKSAEEVEALIRVAHEIIDSEPPAPTPAEQQAAAAVASAAATRTPGEAVYDAFMEKAVAANGYASDADYREAARLAALVENV